MQNLKKIKIWLTQIQFRILEEYRMLTQPSLVKIEGINIPIKNYFSTPIKKAIYRGYYEIEELNIIKHHLKANDIVMEVGAGIGLISSYCAKKIGSEKIFAYEANPQLEPYIRETYQINDVCPTLEICLIGDRTGEETFYISENFWSSSITPWNQNCKPMQVRVKSFNEEVRRINPSFLIMDVEGGEYEILKNADFYNIQKLAIELHQKLIGSTKIDFIKEKLTRSGFKINQKFDRVQIGGLEQLFLERS